MNIFSWHYIQPLLYGFLVVAAVVYVLAVSLWCTVRFKAKSPPLYFVGDYYEKEGGIYIGVIDHEKGLCHMFMGPNLNKGCAVSLNEVAEFLQRLSKRTGISYRLPTSLEIQIAYRQLPFLFRSDVYWVYNKLWITDHQYLMNFATWKLVKIVPGMTAVACAFNFIRVS